MATRATILALARVRADQDAAEFPTDAQFYTLLDAAGQAVWYDLLRGGWPARVTSTTFTATGASSYTPAVLASGLVAAVVGVYYVLNGQYMALSRLSDRADGYSATGNQPSSYLVTADNSASGLVIELFPRAATGTCQVDYILEFPGFTSDSTKWPGPGRSDQLVALAAAAMAMRKEGNDQGAAQLDREYAVLLQSVIEMGSWFDLRNSAVIRDVQPLTPSRDPFDFDV
jgi:hypothetical protein